MSMPIPPKINTTLESNDLSNHIISSYISSEEENDLENNNILNVMANCLKSSANLQNSTANLEKTGTNIENLNTSKQVLGGIETKHKVTLIKDETLKMEATEKVSLVKNELKELGFAIITHVKDGHAYTKPAPADTNILSHPGLVRLIKKDEKTVMAFYNPPTKEHREIRSHSHEDEDGQISNPTKVETRIMTKEEKEEFHQVMQKLQEVETQEKESTTTTKEKSETSRRRDTPLETKESSKKDKFDRQTRGVNTIKNQNLKEAINKETLETRERHRKERDEKSLEQADTIKREYVKKEALKQERTMTENTKEEINKDEMKSDIF